ncbi:glycosyltransferase family 4 protein [Methanobrevibacter sp.]
MEVTLISRYFDTRNMGIGSHSKLIFDGLSLKKGVKLNKISQDDSIIPPSVPFSYFLYVRYLNRILKKKMYENSDIFHSLSPLESIYMPKNRGVSSILDLIPLYGEDSTPLNVNTKIFKRGIQSSLECERIVVNNPDLKNTLISEYGAEESSISVIPPPIDSKYHPMDNHNDVYTIGTISGLYDRKRVDVLIESFLKADIENSRLLIGGGGVELSNLKRLANNDERIQFLGFVDDDHMNDFYNQLDVFVFPTLVEGYGMPIVEAMACGKPVITLEDADIPNNLKERTMVCSKENLYRILQERNFSCNIKNNLEFSKEHSIENTASELMKVYESI